MPSIPGVSGNCCSVCRRIVVMSPFCLREEKDVDQIEGHEHGRNRTVIGDLRGRAEASSTTSPSLHMD